MKLTRFRGWSPLPYFLCFAFSLMAGLVATPDHPNLGPGIILSTLVITGLLDGIVNHQFYEKRKIP